MPGRASCSSGSTATSGTRSACSRETSSRWPRSSSPRSAIERFFRVRGAYGSDHEDRNELPAIAAERICAQTGRELAPDAFVIVGDTPRDIHAARALRHALVAVATGHSALDELAAHGRTPLLADLCDVDRTLEALDAVER